MLVLSLALALVLLCYHCISLVIESEREHTGADVDAQVDTLLYTNNAKCLKRKRQVSIFKWLVWLVQESNPWVWILLSSKAGDGRSIHLTTPPSGPNDNVEHAFIYFISLYIHSLFKQYISNIFSIPIGIENSFEALLYMLYILTCWLHSAASLGYHAASTMTEYPSESLYPVMEKTSHCHNLAEKLHIQKNPITT